MQITEYETALLAKYYRTVTLTGKQKDRLVELYWATPREHRRYISAAYPHIFSQDGDFVQRLCIYHDMHYNSINKSNGIQSSTNTCGSFSSKDESLLNKTRDENDRATSSATVNIISTCQSPTRRAGGRMPHSQLLLRTAIQEQFPKLTGDGPFPLSFGVVTNEADREQVIHLYCTRFLHPDPQEIQKLVTLPQAVSTRTRRRVNGNYTWFIRCHTTSEMVCAVTITVHHHETHDFAEMSLFATAAGYKKNGFGRLLNSALMAWCSAADLEFVMISADANATPFWSHLGYAPMSKSELTRIAFYYENYCTKFEGAEPMIGYCHPKHLNWSQRGAGMRKRPRGTSSLNGDEQEGGKTSDSIPQAEPPLDMRDVAAVINRMPRFVMKELSLPDP